MDSYSYLGSTVGLKLAGNPVCGTLNLNHFNKGFMGGLIVSDLVAGALHQHEVCATLALGRGLTCRHTTKTVADENSILTNARGDLGLDHDLSHRAFYPNHLALDYTFLPGYIWVYPGLILGVEFVQPLVVGMAALVGEPGMAARNQALLSANLFGRFIHW